MAGFGEVSLTEKWVENNPTHEYLSLVGISLGCGASSRICLHCRGVRGFCGKSMCPVLVRVESIFKHRDLICRDHVEGTTPPALFVGRIGYPKVYVGPMIPPYHGDTEILDTPEFWVGKSILDIVDYRYSLVRGKVRFDVADTQNPPRLLEDFQELAMSKRPAEAEAIFSRRPSGPIILDEYVQPFGPSAPMKKFIVPNISVDSRIERAFYDTDMKASEAILSLYDAGVLVTRIQRAFSLGMFGTRSRRRLVPTRWAITAVDTSISSRIIEEIKKYPTIDEYYVYTFKNIGNLYAAIFIPESWSFEWIEAWYPKTFWNYDGSTPELMGDYETYGGRTSYASVGGCYYAARLAVAEKLRRISRQASCLVLREIHPDYILPVGVWNVRESVRAMLKTEPVKFDTLHRAISHTLTFLTIPLKDWVRASVTLRVHHKQRKIVQYVRSFPSPVNYGQTSLPVNKAQP
ncbi:MAG: Nre family DNA repair protein [Candidatus Bathyarchaeia archaeon]